MTEEVILKSKDQMYRGKTLVELQALDVRETAKYMPARSRRSVLRHFQMIENFVKRCQEYVAKNKKIRTHNRDLVIVPHLVGLVIFVYNGKTFNEVRITHQMIGHRLGEFSLSRVRVHHGTPGIGSTKSSAGDKK